MPLLRRLFAEAMGTLLLVASVVGSGIMAQRLAGGNEALALLCNTIATGAMLPVLIVLFSPISGAHLNPAVSFMAAIEYDLSWREVLAYGVAQILGGCLGALLANAMFALPFELATTVRFAPHLWLSEGVATFGLLLVIIGLSRQSSPFIPYAVGLYIAAAYWFTASSGFANPAVTIARIFSNSYAGIAPASVIPFIAAQMVGTTIAMVVARLLWPKP